MDDYVRARPDIYFTGRDGSLRSNRVLCQLAGQYAVDAFVGATLQMDKDANSSTVTAGRLAGFGGAPNMGSDARGRRHASPAWLAMMTSEDEVARGRKLVVQTLETFHNGRDPAFVETLDAVAVGRMASMPIAPVMIFGKLAYEAMVAEAVLTPKPGLVDRRGAGSHPDLSLDLMLASARAIEPCFVGIADLARDCEPGLGLREELAH